jgi:hypothetical protein
MPLVTFPGLLLGLFLRIIYELNLFKPGHVWTIIKIYLRIAKQNLYRIKTTQNLVPSISNVHSNTFNRSNVKSKTWIDVHTRISYYAFILCISRKWQLSNTNSTIPTQTILEFSIIVPSRSKVYKVFYHPNTRIVFPNSILCIDISHFCGFPLCVVLSHTGPATG